MLRPWKGRDLTTSRTEQMRRARDSNPRYRFQYDGFQDRSIQPLWQLSNFCGSYGIRTRGLLRDREACWATTPRNQLQAFRSHMNIMTDISLYQWSHFRNWVNYSPLIVNSTLTALISRIKTVLWDSYTVGLHHSLHLFIFGKRRMVLWTTSFTIGITMMIKTPGTPPPSSG